MQNEGPRLKASVQETVGPTKEAGVVVGAVDRKYLLRLVGWGQRQNHTVICCN